MLPQRAPSLPRLNIILIGRSAEQQCYWLANGGGYTHSASLKETLPDADSSHFKLTRRRACVCVCVRSDASGREAWQLQGHESHKVQLPNFHFRVFFFLNRDGINPATVLAKAERQK